MTHPQLRRSTRISKGKPPSKFAANATLYSLLQQAPPKLVDSYSAALFSSHKDDVPTSHKAAMQRDDADKWREAEQAEMHQLEKLQVGNLVLLPAGARLLPSKWVYSYKRTSGLYKARFVARGDKQRPGEDFLDTFASVVRPETLRSLMALVNSGDLEAHAFDIVTAFLYALMQGQPPIYVRPPPGYETYDEEGRLLVLLLLRALYGLRQSPRLWYEDISAFLGAHGFLPLPSDPCVLRHNDGHFFVLWVDDIITISSTIEGIARMQKILQSRYEVRQMGELTEYLGLTII
ncbi:unnamed protein product [Calypogeia fissa]